MFDFSSGSFLVVFISLAVSAKCQDGYEVLHFTRDFSRRTIDVVPMKNFNYPELIHPTATACPAQTEEEDAFNKQQSLGKNSLFVRNTYAEKQTSHDVDYYICKTPLKLSVLYNNKHVDFQFGFEVYHDKSKFADEHFVESNRGDYDPITNTHAYKNYIRPFLPYIPNMSIPGVSRLLGTSLYLDKDRKKEMGFSWIDTFKMKFNFRAKRVAQSVYGLSLTTRSFHGCDDYDLGKEFFSGLEIDELYGESNQSRMLEGILLPAESDDKFNEMTCVFENQCFVKWLSVPAELFHHLAASPISCSDLLTVPVWKSTIYDVLNKLDNFLFTLSIVLGHPIGDLTVNSGAHGALELPIKSRFRSTKPVTLAENGIQVPNVIYKLVKYRTKMCGDPEDENNSESVDNDDEYDSLEASDNQLAEDDESLTSRPKCKSASTAIIVIIHNDPFFNYDKDKICEDMCEKWGWEIIKYKKLSEEMIKSNFIYCCHANDNEVRKNLGINYQNDDESDIEYASNNFSLKDFPVYDLNTHRFQFGNVHERVVDTYNRLFKGDKFQSDVYDRIDLLKEHYQYQARKEYLMTEEPKNDQDGPQNSEIGLQLEDEEVTENSIVKNADSSNDK